MSEADAIARQVHGSSFYAGMRVLPPSERAAMYAVYAFCRAVDDIADDQEGTRDARRQGLDRWRQDLEALYARRDPGQAAYLAEAVGRYGLRHADFTAVIDGMQMDVDEDIRAPEFPKLDLYCDRVASAVGRLSVRIFGMEEGPGIELAHHLGRALQFTNILRDLDEDAGIGRLYLPAEHLRDVGVTTDEPSVVVADPRVDGAARRLAALAHEHYRQADGVLAARPAGRLLAPRLMSAVYAEILSRAEAQGWAPPRRRARLGKLDLTWVVLKRVLIR